MTNIKLFYLAVVLAIVVTAAGCSSSKTFGPGTLQTDHPPSQLGAIGGEPEDWDKTPHRYGVTYPKVSDYGAFWTEHVPGRILIQLHPPEEPGEGDWWTVPDAFDVRAVFGEGDSATDSARLKIEYNVSGETNGAVVSPILVPAGVSRPIQGALKLKVTHGRASVYGFYTKPVVDDE